MSLTFTFLQASNSEVLLAPCIHASYVSSHLGGYLNAVKVCAVWSMLSPYVFILLPPPKFSLGLLVLQPFFFFNLNVNHSSSIRECTTTCKRQINWREL